MRKVIEVDGLTKVYPGGFKALDGVSFHVEEGEIFAYLGRNGAGKTTTLRILTTLTAKTAGRATVAGRDLDTHPSDLKQRLGVALQETALDDLMTGREHLELVARLAGLSGSESRRRTKELLETLELVAAANRVVGTYSGGMRRRLDVAMALIHRPQILFLDEPTTGLDPQTRRALWRMIQDLCANGATVFLTTQHLEEADELAQRVAILHSGRLAAIGRPEELKLSIGRSVVTLSSSEHTRLRDVIGRLGVAATFDDGKVVRLELSGDGDRLTELLNHLQQQGVRITSISVSERTLEDVFLRLTGDGLDGSGGAGAAGGLTAARRLLGVTAGGQGK